MTESCISSESCTFSMLMNAEVAVDFKEIDMDMVDLMLLFFPGKEC